MSYQYIVLDSIFNFEKDGEYAGFTDVNGLAYKQKAIRDDNIAAEVLTSLLELFSAIFIPAAAGAVVGKIAANSLRIAKFLAKVSETTTTIINYTNKAISTIKRPLLRYGINTLGRSVVKGAGDISKAAVVGLPTRLAKGDDPGTILKNYGIALLGAVSVRSVGSLAYDSYLYKRVGSNILEKLVKDRTGVIKQYGIKKQLEDKLLNIVKRADRTISINKLDKDKKRSLYELYKLSKVKLDSFDEIRYDVDFKNHFEIKQLSWYEDLLLEGEVEHISNYEKYLNKNFLTTQLADDITKAILKGSEKFSFIAISKNLLSVLKKLIITKILQVSSKTVVGGRLLVLYKRLVKKRKDILRKIKLSLEKIKDKFFKTFNLRRVKELFDKEELRKYKRIKEATNFINRENLTEKEKIIKLTEADEFLLKNQKLIPFDEGKGEGNFGSEWLLGYKWIAKYNNITKDLEANGSLRIFFRARYPKTRYRYSKDRKGNNKKFERTIFKAAITFKEVPFEFYEEFLEAESQGSFYWYHFAKRKGSAGWKPRTNTDIDWLLGQQNYSEIYGLQIKGLSTDITKNLLSYNNAGVNILKYQGKTKEILNFIKKPTQLVKTNLNTQIKKISRI